MIAYLDTSSLVKLYVEEKGSPAIADLVRSSEVTATSLVAYAEARAAFARRFREKAFTRDEYEILTATFDDDWAHYLKVGVTGTLLRLAGDLAETHGLRGFDAIHLAASLTLKRELTAPILFSCFDTRLQNASAREGLDQP